MSSCALSDRDQAFFSAFQALITAQFPDLSERFGLWRVHQHFPQHEDQVLYETSNDESQTSCLRLIPSNALPDHAIPSTWMVSHSQLRVCSYCCDFPDDPLPPPRPVPPPHVAGR